MIIDQSGAFLHIHHILGVSDEKSRSGRQSLLDGREATYRPRRITNRSRYRQIRLLVFGRRGFSGRRSRRGCSRSRIDAASNSTATSTTYAAIHSTTASAITVVRNALYMRVSQVMRLLLAVLIVRLVIVVLVVIIIPRLLLITVIISGIILFGC